MSDYVLDPDGVEARLVIDETSLTDARVLEVGCGDGRLTRIYAARARSVVGLEPNAEKVRAAQMAIPRHAGTVQFVLGGALPWRFGASCFETVFFSHSL